MDLYTLTIAGIALLIGLLVGVALCRAHVNNFKQQITHAAVSGDPIAVGVSVLHVVAPSAHYRYKVAEKFMHDSLKRRAEKHEFLERFNNS